MDVSVIEQAILDINKMHKTFSNDYFTQVHSKFNLKKTKVKDVLFDKNFDPVFLNFIEQYHTELILLDNDFADSYTIYNGRSRIKQKESIYNKLIYYGENNEQGELPIQKCLNDLMGFRLEVQNLNHNDGNLCSLMEQLKQDIPLMRWYLRDKEGYCGTHVYFKNKNNFYFPWELQLWSTNDSQSNELSHRLHKSKRDYISWPEKYKRNM